MKINIYFGRLRFSQKITQNNFQALIKEFENSNVCFNQSLSYDIIVIFVVYLKDYQ